MIAETTAIHSVLNAVAAPVLICQHNRILFANQAVQKLTGYSFEKMSGMGLSNLIHETSSPIFQSWYSQQPAQTHLTSLDVRLVTQHTALVWVNISAAATGYQGQAAIMLTLHDTTATRSAENRLFMSEAHSQMLLENNPDVMIVADYKGHFVYVSPSVEPALGHPVDAVIGQLWQEWVHNDDIHIVTNAIDEVRQTAKTVKIELRISHRAYGYVWCEAILGFLYNRHDNQTHLVSIIRNIHQHKLTEFALREREQRLRVITDNMLDIVVEVDPDGLMQYVSPSCLPILGYQPEELIGDSQITRVHPDDIATVLEYFSQAQTNGDLPPLEFRFKHKAGHYLWLQIIYTTVLDEQGQVQSIISSCREITTYRKNREILQEQQQMLTQITDIAPFGIYIYDVKQRRDVYHNRRLIQEATPENFPNESRGDFYDGFVHPDELAQHQAHQKRLMEAKDGEVIESENRIRRPDGTFTWFYFRDTVFKRDEEGKPSQFIGSMLDVTARKNAEDTLRKNQHLLQQITDTIPLDIYIYDVRQKRNIYFNRSENLGYSLEVLNNQESGEFYAHLVHPDDLVRHRANGQRLLQSKDGEIIESEYRMKHASGEWRWYYFRDIVFMRDENGLPVQFLGSIQDITQRKQTEAALVESQQVLRQVTSTVPLDIYIYDCDLNKSIFTNRATNLGLDAQLSLEADSEYFSGLVHPDDLALYQDFNTRLENSRDGEYIEGEFRMRRSDGTWMWRNYRNTVLHRHADGTPSQYFGTVEDITKRKETEAALSQSQHMFRQVAETIPLQIYIYDYDLACNIFENRPSDLGFPPEILANASQAFFIDLIHPDDRLYHDRVMERLVNAKDGQILENEFRMRDVNGVYAWRHYRYIPFARHPDGSLRQFLGAILNIDERKRTSDALRDNEEKLRLITDNIHDLVSLTDADLRFRYITPSHTRVLGYELDDLLNKSVFEMVHPDDVESMRNKTLATIEKFQSDTLEFRFRHHDGYYVWMETSSSIIQDNNGAFAGAVFASRDVSERRWMQRAMLEQEKLLVILQKEQELSALKTRMMSRLSHELRTPLAVISTSADLLEMYWSRMNESQRNDRLMQIKTQIKHFTGMLDNMSLVVKGISYNLDFTPTPYNLRHTCETLIAELKELLHSSHTIQLELSGEMEVLNSDEQLIYLILTHLLANAIKYSHPSNPITINGSVIQDKILLAVHDQGIGIPTDEQDKIFEPFYRGTNIGEVPGLGIGLSIVKDAVEAMNGSLNIESKLGVGTTVKVEVPLGGMIGLN